MRKFLPKSLVGGGALAIVLASSAGMARDTKVPDTNANIPARLIDPVATALKDFKKRRPKGWPCYGVYVSTGKEGELRVTFGSSPVDTPPGVEMLGDTGHCGPTLTYAFDSHSRIAKVTGLR